MSGPNESGDTEARQQLSARWPTPESAESITTIVWSRVVIYCAIVVVGGWALALAMWWLMADVGGSGALVRTVLLATLYMPLPLVAGLIVEFVAQRRPILLIRSLRTIRSRPRLLLRLMGVGIIPVVVVCLLATLISVILALARVPGAGTIITSGSELVNQLSVLSGQAVPASVADSLPPIPVLYLASLIQAVVLGATMNALFALGEEYGWRGVLAEELSALGLVRANLIIGVVWGLWHAPLIILLGHNFGAQWQWGVPMMVALCLPLGFVLSWASAQAGIFAAAVGHGVFNAVAGLSLLLVAGASPLITPSGVASVIAAACIAVVLWRGIRSMPVRNTS